MLSYTSCFCLIINFFIQEYKIMRASFVKDSFCLLLFLRHFIFYNCTQFLTAPCQVLIRDMKLTEKVIFDQWLKLYLGLNAEGGVQIYQVLGSLYFSDLCTMRQLKYLYPLYFLVVVSLSAFCRFILVTNGHFHLFNTVHWTYFVDVNEQKGNGVFFLLCLFCMCVSVCVGRTVGSSENVRERKVVIQGLRRSCF